MRLKLYRKFILLLLVGIALLTLNSVNFLGCNTNPVSPLETVKFSKDILPIFIQNCAHPTCHASSIQNPDDLELTSWHSLMEEGYEYGAAVIPYNAFWSSLMSHINRDTNLSIVAEPIMPKYGPPYSQGIPLPPNVVKLISQWINEGAKNDYGEVVFSSITDKAFITNQASDYVAVVNLENNFLVRLVPVGGRPNQLDVPHHVTVDNQGRYFYPALISEGYLEKYDAYTYERVGRLLLGSAPAEIFLLSNGTRGYVTNWDASGFERSVKFIDTQNMIILDTISDFRMKATHGGRVTHNDNYFICVSQLSEYIHIIRTSDNQIEDAIPVDDLVPPNGNGTNLFLPYGISITPDDRYGFITCPKSNDVRVLDIQARSIIRRILVGQNPLMSEVSPDGQWCYVPNRNSNSVSVIRIVGQTFTVVKTIPNVGVQPHGVDFTQDGHYAYVTCESQQEGNPYVHHPITQNIKPGTTAVIDVWGGHVKIKDIEMASFPNGISITPN